MQSAWPQILMDLLLFLGAWRGKELPRAKPYHQIELVQRQNLSSLDMSGFDWTSFCFKAGLFFFSGHLRVTVAPINKSTTSKFVMFYAYFPVQSDLFDNLMTSFNIPSVFLVF